jgi:L-ascorbate metabolism protein UlaG (beta-lactamase superfamily)
VKLVLPVLALFALGCAAPRLAVMRDTPPAPAVTERLAGAAAAPLTVRRVVHASVLLEVGDLRVLTDPWFSETDAYNHGEPLALSIDKLPKLTAVVVSHGHYDHFDIAAFAAYPDKSVPMIVRTEMVEAAKAAGFTDVRALEHGQRSDVAGGALQVTATPAAHGVPESTYVIELGGYTVYFGGDTRLIPELRDIPKKFPNIDLAIVAVNGLTVTGAGQMVMNAQEAAELVAMLHAKVAVPMHYTFHGNWFTDTFILSYTGTPADFVTATKAKSPSTKVHVLEPGAPLVLTRAPDTEDTSGASKDAPDAPHTEPPVDH